MSKQSFTLIELLLTISLVFIIAGSSTAFYSRFLTQNSVLSIQEHIEGNLHKAQMYSITGKRASSWGVYLAPQIITLFRGNSYAERDINFDETYSYPQSVSITGVTAVMYSRVSGLPSSSGIITISGPGSSKSLEINSQGVVTKN